MRQRDPCCWKWTSSRAQRSTATLAINRRSFFVSLLPRWICLCQNRPGLTETELQLPNQPLALAHAQLDSIGPLDPRRERLAIPEIDSHAGVTGLCTQHLIDLLYLFSLSRLGRPDRSPSVR